jgi:iron complex outermembrane receptor protein
MKLKKTSSLTLVTSVLVGGGLLTMASDVFAQTTEVQTVVVTARKWTEPLQSVPGAVTVQSADSMKLAGVRDLRDAARYVPNLTLGDFSVRRLTFPYLRGIGSGRNSAAVTTIIDGVPQLSYATANQEFLDVERVEFLRGPQGALYGRNTLGGAINVVPRLPGREPVTSVSLAGGDAGFFDTRVSTEGPVGPHKAAGSLSAGYSTRDGYTKNDVTGNQLDSRESFFGRAQVLWPDEGSWSYRFSVNGEADRDGDYALGDLASLRARPYHVAHDYEGGSERDLSQPVFTATRRGAEVDLTSITAFQWWRSHDQTDLDATPADLIRRDNAENQEAWIEDLRLTSAEASPVQLGERVTLRWLLGTMAYHSAYQQRAFNDYRPGAVAMLGLPLAYQQHDDADLNDAGINLYGQGVVTVDERLELGLGLRNDYEHRSADLRQYANPAFMPGATRNDEQDFNQISPRASLGYRLTPDILPYVQASKGYKAGGFNTMAIPGHTEFSEETSLTYEAGLKTAWLKNRVVVNATVFRTDWDDLQLDVPAGAPGVFFIDNAGKALSEGGELELSIRPVSGLALFGGVGLLTSEFRSDSRSGGTDISGNELPFAPHLTWHAGTEFSQLLYARYTGFIRLEGVGTGSYYYDASNAEAQDNYVLVNTRVGVGTRLWRVETWVSNLFDQDYVPIAFPYQLAPSGYVGENGAPRTVGLSLSRVL